MACALLDYHSLIECAKKEKLLKEKARKSKKLKKEIANSIDVSKEKSKDAIVANTGIGIPSINMQVRLKPKQKLREIIESIKNDEILENEDEENSSSEDSSQSEDNMNQQEKDELKKGILSAVNEFNNILINGPSKKAENKVDSIDQDIHSSNEKLKSTTNRPNVDLPLKPDSKISLLGHQITKLAKLDTVYINSYKGGNHDQKASARVTKVPNTDTKEALINSMETERTASKIRPISLHKIFRDIPKQKKWSDPKKMFLALHPNASHKSKLFKKESIINTQRSLSTSEAMKEFCVFNGKRVLNNLYSNQIFQSHPESKAEVNPPRKFSGRNAVYSNKNILKQSRVSYEEHARPSYITSSINHPFNDIQKQCISLLRKSMYKRRITTESQNYANANEGNPCTTKWSTKRGEILKRMHALAKCMQCSNYDIFMKAPSKEISVPKSIKYGPLAKLSNMSSQGFDNNM